MSPAGPPRRLVLLAILVAAVLGALLALVQGPASHKPHRAPVAAQR